MNDHNLRPNPSRIHPYTHRIITVIICHPIHVNCAPKEPVYTEYETDEWWEEQDKDEEWIARNSE